MTSVLLKCDRCSVFQHSHLGHLSQQHVISLSITDAWKSMSCYCSHCTVAYWPSSLHVKWCPDMKYFKAAKRRKSLGARSRWCGGCYEIFLSKPCSKFYWKLRIGEIPHGTGQKHSLLDIYFQQHPASQQTHKFNFLDIKIFLWSPLVYWLCYSSFLMFFELL